MRAFAPGHTLTWAAAAKALAAGLFLVMAAYFAFGPSRAAFAGEGIAVSAEEIIVDPSETQGSYARFPHTTAQHARMPCLLCHKRDDNSARPRMPGHLPCSSCHTDQFAMGNASPMCNICHTATGVKPFPGLRSFNVRFDHGRHLRQTGCATCHKPARRGVALSIPSGTAAHSTCYACHGPRTEIGGRNIGSCGTCHQSGRPTRTSENAKAYTVNFSHQEHSRRGLTNCSSCHTVRAGAARGRQVSAPLASMHFAPAGRQSCAACHNGKRAFGAQDFANCKRCHEGRTFSF